MFFPIILCELDYCGSFEETSKFSVKHLPDKNTNYFNWVRAKISKLSKKKSLNFLKKEIRVHKRKVKRYKRVQKRWWDDYSSKYSLNQKFDKLTREKKNIRERNKENEMKFFLDIVMFPVVFIGLMLLILLLK